MTEVIVLDDSDSDVIPPPPRPPPASTASACNPPTTSTPSFLSNLRRTLESPRSSCALPETSDKHLIRTTVSHPTVSSPEIIPPRAHGHARGSKTVVGDVPPQLPSSECNNLNEPPVSTQHMHITHSASYAAASHSFSSVPCNYFDIPPPFELDHDFETLPSQPVHNDRFPARSSQILNAQFEHSAPFASCEPSIGVYRPSHVQNSLPSQYRPASASPVPAETVAELSATTATVSVAPSGPSTVPSSSGGSARAVRRDRVDILLSRELASRPDGLSLVGKLLSYDGASATVTTLAESNMLEWRQEGTVIEESFNVVAFYFGADQFVNLISSGDVQNLARRLRHRHTHSQIYFLLHDVQSFCRKAARRRLRSTALTIGEDDGMPMIVSEMAVEDCCTFLYFEFDIRSRMFENSEHIARFCVDIKDAVAKRPYMEELNFVNLRAAYVRGKTGHNAATLCVEHSGNVRPECRTDIAASYQAFLGLVPGVSVSRAKAIRKVYPTLAVLLEAYGKCANEKEKEIMLADVVEKGRRIGPALSKTIAKVLTSTNATLQVSRG